LKDLRGAQVSDDYTVNDMENLESITSQHWPTEDVVVITGIVPRRSPIRSMFIFATG